MDITINDADTLQVLTCNATEEEEISVTLTWRHAPASLMGRIFNRGSVDLDLGCYYQMRDGRRAVIDGLQFANGEGGPRQKRTLQGCYDYIPYIWHTGDKAGVDAELAEKIIINPVGLEKIRTIMFYTFIYDGEARWGETEVWMRVHVPGNDDVVIDLKSVGSDKKFCLVARIDIKDSHTLQVSRIGEFFNTHSECAAAYGWDLAFKPNTK